MPYVCVSEIRYARADELMKNVCVCVGRGRLREIGVVVTKTGKKKLTPGRI